MFKYKERCCIKICIKSYFNQINTFQHIGPIPVSPITTRSEPARRFNDRKGKSRKILDWLINKGIITWCFSYWPSNRSSVLLYWTSAAPQANTAGLGPMTRQIWKSYKHCLQDYNTPMPYIKADWPTNVSPYKIIHPNGNDRRQTSFCYGIKIIPTSRINLGGLIRIFSVLTRFQSVQ
jgi:hypothetical protein